MPGTKDYIPQADGSFHLTQSPTSKPSTTPIMAPGQVQQLATANPNLGDAIKNGDVSLRRYNSDPPRYELYWPEVGGNMPVSLKDEEALFSFAQVQKKIFARWKIVIQEIKKNEWHSLITILNAGREEIEAPGASTADSFRDLFDRWTERCIPGVWSKSDLHYKPLNKDGYFYFTVDAFESRALFIQSSRYQYHRQEMDRSRICELLREIGAISTTARFKKDVVRVWKIAEDFNQPMEPPQVEIVPDDEEDGEVGDEPKGEKGETPKDAPAEF